MKFTIEGKSTESKVVTEDFSFEIKITKEEEQ